MMDLFSRGSRRWRARGVWIVFGLATALAASGCACGRKSDEEILKERIDTTSVHLYVATKVAITKTDASPEAAEARKQLLAVLEILANAQRDAAARAKTAPSAVPAAAPVPSAKPSDPAKTPHIELSAADVAKLSVALWKIRNEGKRIVRSGREDELPGVLPILLQGSDLPPELSEMLDVNTEHAMFLLGMFALKFHPRSPVPVPQ